MRSRSVNHLALLHEEQIQEASSPRHALFLFFPVLILLLALAGCTGSGSSDSTGSTVDPGTTAPTGEPGTTTPTGEPGTTTPTEQSSPLVIGSLTGEPPTLDLTASQGQPLRELLLYNVLEGLVQIDNEGVIQPLLAESWEISEDGTVYTFHLVGDAAFHDGAPLTANDVVFTFDRARAPDSSHWGKDRVFGLVVDVAAIDDLTVSVTLSRRSNNWLNLMAGAGGIVLSESSIEQVADQPIGTGPFEIGTWARGDSITLIRNDDYWGAAPPSSEIVIKYIDDPTSQVNALLVGDIDAIDFVLTPETLSRFEGDPEYEVLVGASHWISGLAMNSAREPFDDVLVRRAITQAIDKEAMRAAAFGGFGEFIYAHVPPQDPWFVDLSDLYPYDPEAARALLAEAGYPDGFSAVIRTESLGILQRTAEVAQANLAAVGIQAEIEIVETAFWVSEIFGGDHDYDMTATGHTSPRDMFLRFGDGNYLNYDSPRLLELLSEADQTVDEGQRISLLQQAQRLLADDAPMVWTHTAPNLAVIRSGIEGYSANRLSGAFDLRNVWLRP